MNVFFLPDVKGIIIEKDKQLIRLTKKGYYYTILNPKRLQEVNAFQFEMDLQFYSFYTYDIIYDYVLKEYPEVFL